MEIERAYGTFLSLIITDSTKENVHLKDSHDRDERTCNINEGKTG